MRGLLFPFQRVGEIKDGLLRWLWNILLFLTFPFTSPLFLRAYPYYYYVPHLCSHLFGANRGPRPSADGLASPINMKTFWVIKYLNIYSTNK